MPKTSPLVWEALARASKHQQLLVLQRVFDTAAEYMGMRDLTIATPFLFKLLLALGFRMESQDDLAMGIHPFVLGQHTATFWKFLSGQADRYAMVASPSLADVEILLAPDGVTLPRKFSLVRRQWLRMRFIVRTCFGVDHNAAIDTSLAGNSNLTLLGPYGTGDAGVEIICCRKTVYVPAPYVGLLSSADISPVEACHRLRGAIVNAAAEDACRPLIDWLNAAIV